MTDLLLSIIISSSLFVIFKLFDRFKVNTFNAIVINYIVACITGLFFYKGAVNLLKIPHQEWFTGALFLGLLFISVFMVMAKTSQENGLSVASVAGKMSVIIPVIFAVIVYRDPLNLMKISGIILALVAVYLTSIRRGQIALTRRNLLYPFLLFIGSGIIDTTLKYVETNYVKEEEFPVYSASVFGMAALTGITILSYKALKSKSFPTTKDIIGGIGLGIPNYFSIYFLLKALQHPTFNSSTVFTINNVAIVMLSTIFGIVIFKEKLSPKNWMGIAMAIVSIILIATAKI